MLRRWLIRMPFLLALALVVALWVGSYFGGLSFTKFLGGRIYLIGAVQGIVEFRDFTFVLPPGARVVPFSFRRYATAYYWNWRIAGNPDSLEFIFPLWLPTLLLAGLNWFVWRKTRPKQVGRAFPVEPQKQETETK